MLDPETLAIPAAPPDTFRCGVWNLLDGGTDLNGEGGRRSARRLMDQLRLLAHLRLDVLCVPEATHWAERKRLLLGLAKDTLGMHVVTLAKSREGDGKNHTALLYNPSRLRLVNWRLRGRATFHHALIRAWFRPAHAADGAWDFLVYATHFNPFDPVARLGEARWLTDSGGPFPGLPSAAVLLGDLNTPDRQPDHWGQVPRHLWSRYREFRDGAFGPADEDPVRLLLASGWSDPYDALGIPRPPTVGHYYPNEPVRWALDRALLAGLEPAQAWTHPLPSGKEEWMSDHVPLFVDAKWPGGQR